MRRIGARQNAAVVDCSALAAAYLKAALKKNDYLEWRITIGFRADRALKLWAIPEVE